MCTTQGSGSLRPSGHVNFAIHKSIVIITSVKCKGQLKALMNNVGQLNWG